MKGKLLIVNTFKKQDKTIHRIIRIQQKDILKKRVATHPSK